MARKIESLNAAVKPARGFVSASAMAYKVPMTMARAAGALLVATMLTLTSSCEPDERAARPPKPAVPSEPVSEHPLERAIQERALSSAMRPHGSFVHGELEAGARHDHLLVLESGRCYRVFAASGPGVSDLDLVLFDSSGTQLRQDRSADPYPTLGVGAEICPERGSAFRIQVRVYEGAGPYAYRVYRSGE